MEFLLNGHEINLKGGNRGFFTTRLRANLELLLAGTGAAMSMHGPGFWVQCADAAAPEVRRRLERALGVQSIVTGRRTAPEAAAIAAVACDLIAAQRGESFALRVRRPDKRLALTSYAVACAVGAVVQRELGLRVDLEHPARVCTIVLSRAGALVSRAAERGPGGMPAGTAGRFLALLSTGFDSPVAAFRMIRRGGRVELLHFHSRPRIPGADSAPVAAALARELTRWQLQSRLYLCPFDAVQAAVVSGAPGRFRVLLYRRMMLRIAAALAQRTRCHGLVTGDSLAQVASQTARNLAAVSAALAGAAPLPVYRPLIGDDKVAIQAEAQRLGTFAHSAERTDDCCSAFMPRDPALASTPAELAEAERGLDVSGLTAQALAGIEQRRFRLLAGEVIETTPAARACRPQPDSAITQASSTRV